MQNLERLFIEFSETFTREWHDLEYSKFITHPGNFDKQEEFEVLVGSKDSYDVDTPSKKIDFFNFVYNVHISSFYEDKFNEDKFNWIEDSEQNKIQTLASGKEYETFFCKTQLINWENNYLLHVTKLLLKSQSIKDSIKIIEYHKIQVTREFEEIKNAIPILSNILDKFEVCLHENLDKIKNENYSELLNIITSTQQRICFYGNATKLARIVAQLNDYLEITNASKLCEIISEHFTIKNEPINIHLFAKKVRLAITNHNKQKDK